MNTDYQDIINYKNQNSVKIRSQPTGPRILPVQVRLR
jgi:hypothetical protein